MLYLEVSRSKFLAQKDDCERSRWLCAAVARKRRRAQKALVLLSPAVAQVSFLLHIPARTAEQALGLFLHAGLPGDRSSQLACYDWALTEACALLSGPGAISCVRLAVSRQNGRLSPCELPGTYWWAKWLVNIHISSEVLDVFARWAPARSTASRALSWRLTKPLLRLVASQCVINLSSFVQEEADEVRAGLMMAWLRLVVAESEIEWTCRFRSGCLDSAGRQKSRRPLTTLGSCTSHDTGQKFRRGRDFRPHS